MIEVILYCKLNFEGFWDKLNWSKMNTELFMSLINVVLLLILLNGNLLVLHVCICSFGPQNWAWTNPSSNTNNPERYRHLKQKIIKTHYSNTHHVVTNGWKLFTKAFYLKNPFSQLKCYYFPIKNIHVIKC